MSDVYVRLGYEFNIACRAFNGIGVDTSDLGPVPELLRSILEETLSQEASPASLDKFLPRIRDIIINLLHGLKRKQQRLRAKQGKEGSQSTTQQSVSSGSITAGLNQILDDNPSQRQSTRSAERRTGSGGTISGADNYSLSNGISAHDDGQTITSRYSSNTPAHQNGAGQEAATPRSAAFTNPRAVPPSRSDSTISTSMSMSTSGMPHLDPDSLPIQQTPQASRTPSHKDNQAYMSVPPAQPRQQDALAALQRGGDLERRASRRYSAYQISKHLGASPNGVPMLPPAQNSPIPNRGRELRDSMNAVRTRGSGVYGQQRSGNRTPSPAKTHALSNRISEESSQSDDFKTYKVASNDADDEKLVGEGLGIERAIEKSSESERPRMKATLSSPLEGLPVYSDRDSGTTESGISLEPSKADRRVPITQASISPEQQFVPEQSPQPGKELTLFLQYKSKIKKFVLADGASELSVARLQLAFIEKFAWNTHNNGVDLPEIYIQDPVSGVRHELEDLRDIKDRCVLVLNIEALDEVKKHIDEGLLGIRTLVEGVRTTVNSQQSTLQRVSDKQQDTTREVVRLASSPRSSDPPISAFSRARLAGPGKQASADTLTGIHSLRQDLAVVRQTVTRLVSDMNASMATVQSAAGSIKTMAIEGVMPDLDSSTGRAYVNVGKKNLGDESERIVNSVDDLQDTVEDLRKDVVSRGVRPLPRQLESVGKNISSATADLKKMQEFLRKEKPIWTKIWEKELELVCTDRDLLTLQEELAADLEDDLEKAAQTFALVEQATKQQNLQSRDGINVGLRSVSKGLAAIAMDQDIDPRKAKDGVLGEVRALKPNHESRLEAIERAEKARFKDLATRKDGELTKEIASFVGEGKLKKSGGFEEAERQRVAKDERNRQEVWQREQERKAGKGKERSEPKEEAATDPPTVGTTYSSSIDPALSPSPETEHFANANGPTLDGQMDGATDERPPEIPAPLAEDKGSLGGMLL